MNPRYSLPGILGALALLWFAAAAEAQQLQRGPWLQQGTPTSIIVKWRTDTSVQGVVKYGSTPSLLNNTVTESGSTRDHRVTLTGLSPNTRYYYSIGHGSTTLAGGSDYFFWTAPNYRTDHPTRIWVIGDAGVAGYNPGDARQTAVRNAFLNFNGTNRLDLWLMLGDNAYHTGTDTEYQRAVFDMYPQVLRKSVVWSTLGNHDYAFSHSGGTSHAYFQIFSFPRQGEVGGIPSGSEAYYSFDYANIHFVCLDSMTDSYRRPGSPMLRWLEEDLRNNTQDWLIVFFHHPPYSKGTHSSDNNYSINDYEMVEMREMVIPMLEQYGVDLVLSGHSHNYERSYLIDGHYGYSWTFNDSMKKDGGPGRDPNPYRKSLTGPVPREGAVYVVAGSSGQVPGSPPPLNHPVMYVSLNELGSMVLDVAGNRLDALFLNSNGVQRDTFTLVKGNGLLSAARLLIRPEGAQVRISWAADAGNYILQRSSSLTMPNWSAVLTPARLEGNERVVEEPVNASMHYYRLQSQ